MLASMSGGLLPYRVEGVLEAGIDEAGRGPLFGRVYVAAVILPQSADEFDHSLMKDSKRFSSKKKIEQAYEHIIQRAIGYKVAYADEKEIDRINIRQATLSCMHECVQGLPVDPEHLLVDGCDFKPFMTVTDDGFKSIPHTCIEGGDNKYTAIAAASILAKVERDRYVIKMCDEHPWLYEFYGLRSNKGYGTKKHIDGIRKDGITEWHRRSFGICKTAPSIKETAQEVSIR